MGCKVDGLPWVSAFHGITRGENYLRRRLSPWECFFLDLCRVPFFDLVEGGSFFDLVEDLFSLQDSKVAQKDPGV